MEIEPLLPSFLLQDLALALVHDLIYLIQDLFGVALLIFRYFLNLVKLLHGAELLLKVSQVVLVCFFFKLDRHDCEDFLSKLVLSYDSGVKFSVFHLIFHKLMVSVPQACYSFLNLLDVSVSLSELDSRHCINQLNLDCRLLQHELLGSFLCQSEANFLLGVTLESFVDAIQGF